MALRVIAHNIRSMFNIGAIFRNADAFGVEHVHLTGYTATPPRPEIQKTALGAEEAVPWSHTTDALALIDTLREEGYVIVACESDPDYSDIRELEPAEKLVAIFGNEPDGIPPELLERADLRALIPMRGTKSSLNVAVASGVALWELSRQNNR